jgi:hypothetical protein
VTNKRSQAPDTKISKQPAKSPKPSRVEFDLTDEELEKVSGGAAGARSSAIGSVVASTGG